MNLFGFEISRKIKKSSEGGLTEKEPLTLPSFSNPQEPDTAYVDGGYTSGYFGQVLDLEGLNFTSETDLIQKYRAAATQPECDTAINDIVNAAIVSDSDDAPVDLILDKSDLPQNIKDLIREEFDTVLRLLSFNFDGHDIFRRWYIDGKIYYHLMVDPQNPRAGIQEVRMIDPVKIKKVKEYTTHTERGSGEKIRRITAEYYLYTEDSTGAAGSSTGLKIDPNSVVYVPSGVLDHSGKISISHLHKCVKLVNQLRMMEDALVIYRISRAPERRIFYIDVGNLQKGKAEEYVQGIMSRYRNKLIYDASTGEIQEDRKSMSILEDFWLPRREGGRGTEIQTLPGGENLGQIEDVLFFQRKLYRALNIPVSRLEAEGAYNIGRVSEISREEVKFQKFINRLRRRFSTLFIDILRVQCLLKNICTEEEWPDIRETMAVDYIEDNFFSELKDFEILKERLSMLDAVQPHIGKYYSEKWVRSNILNLSDEDIERMELENAVSDEPESEPVDDGSGMDFGGEEPAPMDFSAPEPESEPIPDEEPEDLGAETPPQV